MYVMAGVQFDLICQVKEKFYFENALVEKSESSTSNKKWIS